MNTYKTTTLRPVHGMKRNVRVCSVTRETPPKSINSKSWTNVREKLEHQRQEKLKDNVNSLVSIAQNDIEFLQNVWQECTGALTKLVDSHKKSEKKVKITESDSE
jgi:hypothetical protein